MTELSRSLLAAARDGLAPDPAVAARVRARVAAAVGAPAPAPGPASATAAPATAAPATKAAFVGKLGALLLVAGAVTGIALREGDARVDAPRVAAIEAREEVEGPVSSTLGHDGPSTLSAAGPASTGRAKQVDLAAPARTKHSEPVPLSREVELIDQAMASLRVHDAGAALAALRIFDRETVGHAQMAEEAAAISIEARCTLHQDVGERLAAFDRMWPSSAQRARITATCR